jgi:hypothetical protein
MNNSPLISKADLLAALGPAPTIEETATFLRRDPANVYRMVYSGDLETLPGLGLIKISIPSLLRYLNGGSIHVVRAPKNKRLGAKKTKAREVGA